MQRLFLCRAMRFTLGSPDSTRIAQAVILGRRADQPHGALLGAQAIVFTTYSFPYLIELGRGAQTEWMADSSRFAHSI